MMAFDTTPPSPQEEKKAVNFKMLPAEFASLRAQVQAISLQDVHLGRLLENLLLHVGHSHGLDPAQEDAKAAKSEEETAKAEHAAAEKAAAEADANAQENASPGPGAHSKKEGR